jgi:hypothetical protein
VRFKGESSIGSAILREWMDLVGADAFCNPKNHLLLSYDRGQSYMFDPVAPYINPKWQHDYELLGRLIGLALYHQVLYPEHHARSRLLVSSAGGERHSAAPLNSASRMRGMLSGSSTRHVRR